MTGFGDIRERHISKKGRIVTLQRGNTASVSILAFFSVWRPEDIVNTPLRQGDVRVDTTDDLGTFPIPPRDPDIIITPENKAYTILFANPVYDGATLIGWTMAARGA